MCLPETHSAWVLLLLDVELACVISSVWDFNKQGWVV